MIPLFNFRSTTTKKSAIEAAPLAVIASNFPSTPSPSATDSAIHTWLDNITTHVAFDDVMFLDESKAARQVGRKRTTFFNEKMLTGGEVVDASVVFWMANGDIVYDRDAMEVFLGDIWEECVYWGPRHRVQEMQAVRGDDGEYSLNEVFVTADEGAESEYCDSEASFGFFDARLHDADAASMNSSLLGCKSPADEASQSNDANSEASFGCATTADHNATIASKEATAHAAKTLASFAINQVVPPKEVLDFAKRIVASPSLALTLPPTAFPPTISTLPLRNPYYISPTPYFNKKSNPPPALLIATPTPEVTPPIVTTPLYPHDPTAPLRALQASIRSTRLNWPTHAPNCVPLLTLTLSHKLPAPRLSQRPPRPTTAIFQPMHHDVRIQQETARPLWLTIITKAPDEVAAPGKMFRWEYESMRSIEGLRTKSVGGMREVVRGIVPEEWRGRVKKVKGKMGWKGKVGGGSYWERHGGEQVSRVVRNGKGELVLVGAVEEHGMPVLTRSVNRFKKALWMG